jgi:hypothetical protein
VTSSGERQLAIWREVLTKLRDIAPETADAPLRGSIMLTAPELFGRLRVMPLLKAFLQVQPKAPDAK